MALIPLDARDDSLVDELRELALFRDCESEALERLGRLAICHEHPENNILLYQGDPFGPVYLVLSGRVKVTLTNEEGKEVVVTLARRGDIVGLIAAMDKQRQPANAITAARSRLAKFDGGTFIAWMEGQRVTHRTLLGALVRRVRYAYQKIGEHALLGVKERLLLTLLEIAEREGERDPQRGTVVFTRPTHKELAHRIGSSREVVTRLLKEILQSDMLQAEGRVIRVSSDALVLREE